MQKILERVIQEVIAYKTVYLCLGIAWFLIVIPTQFTHILGVVFLLVTFIIGIVYMSKGNISTGLAGIILSVTTAIVFLSTALTDKSHATNYKMMSQEYRKAERAKLENSYKDAVEKSKAKYEEKHGKAKLWT